MVSLHRRYRDQGRGRHDWKPHRYALGEPSGTQRLRRQCRPHPRLHGETEAAARLIFLKSERLPRTGIIDAAQGGLNVKSVPLITRATRAISRRCQAIDFSISRTPRASFSLRQAPRVPRTLELYRGPEVPPALRSPA